jgi:hypothetical protein
MKETGGELMIRSQMREDGEWLIEVSDSLWATANAGPGATFLFTLLTEAGEQLASPT